VSDHRGQASVEFVFACGLAAAVALGTAFSWMALTLYRGAERRAALRLYLFSLAYLALLFGAMVLDAKL
jgi:protoheme IX farnesyltransferase